MSDRLSNTAYVILGALQYGPKSGYDIKARVDISTRFFFSASYGQIYPELKRLEAGGLISGNTRNTGRRKRTVYELTADGGRLLREWLLRPGAGIEMRDEGLLKVFFSGPMSGREQLDRVVGLRDERQFELAELLAIQQDLPEEADDMHRAVLDYGIGLYEYVIDWCDRYIKERTRR